MTHPITYTRPATYAGIIWREVVLVLPNTDGYLCPRLHLRQSRKGSATWDIVEYWIDSKGRSHYDTLVYDMSLREAKSEAARLLRSAVLDSDGRVVEWREP
jgi:outer membrane cobalamin receptor